MNTIDSLVAELRRAHAQLDVAEFMCSRAKEAYDTAAKAQSAAEEKVSQAEFMLLVFIKDNRPSVTATLQSKPGDNWKFTGNEF